MANVPGIQNELDDVAQDVMVVLLSAISGFERQRDGSFRKWLRQITVNRLREYWRQRAKRPLVGFDDSSNESFFSRLEDPRGDLAGEWDREYDRRVFAQLTTAVRADFQPDTWIAFHRFALDGVPAAQVAAELGLTVNAVVQAKRRVLKRLREEAGVLID
ncbi:putative ECF sigma factor [Fimbriiglobus ruber]|uniref:Putative ECF sigma factor n=1 Tax=Fimbriiglobus ruber TaxID=1908690 RepID=A0A225E1R7_9BACT|nr:putative ECF sigma factor [Fimbriiglobus ruber]